MSSGRIAVTLTAGVATLVAALHGSAYLTYRLLGFDASPPWHAWWQYANVAQRPTYASVAWRIHLAGALGIGVPVFLFGVVMVLLWRRSKGSLYGEARFARRADLARHGMFDPSPTGLVVGRLGRRLIRMPGQQFALLAAPTRSGKGVGIVAVRHQPSLRTCVVRSQARPCDARDRHRFRQRRAG
ncbi:hypothetical protein P3W33_09585 [Luteibacter sp. PPL552]